MSWGSTGFKQGIRPSISPDQQTHGRAVKKADLPSLHMLF